MNRGGTWRMVFIITFMVLAFVFVFYSLFSENEDRDYKKYF